MDKLKILILNGDLPTFPGRGCVEFLNTINLAKKRSPFANKNTLDTSLYIVKI